MDRVKFINLLFFMFIVWGCQKENDPVTPPVDELGSISGKVMNDSGIQLPGAVTTTNPATTSSTTDSVGNYQNLNIAPL